ncbi:hypothetical protein BDV93DRAFT_557630 [Ceratobasidium sp. AG-I]|nr:hypothetical protein BDV93DRAFT_557630 [Ceratobasidium sp. AG-I]
MSAMSAVRRPASSSTASAARPRKSTGGTGGGSDQGSPRVAVRSSTPLSEQGTARASPLARGATARAAAPPPSPRINGASLVLEGTGSSGETTALEGALRREVEEKEELMMRLSNRDETIAKLNTEIAEMQAAMGQGEARLMELYADQERWETERAGLEEEIGKKSNVIDKLRIQLREIEKENRDGSRRLAEQAAQFESERQAFYDNTTHLKSRIQSLTDAQREWREHQAERQHEDRDGEEGGELKEDADTLEGGAPRVRRSEGRDADAESSEPPEMTALRLELSTLGTSHGSLGQTVKMLQGQLAEIERVNMSLQEENEAYTTLLREKTLSGQIDIMRRGEADGEESADESVAASREGGESEQMSKAGSLSPIGTRRPSYAMRRPVSPAQSGRSARSVKSARKIAAETLADLPVAGPGLDLAAELGRAEVWEGEPGVDEEKEGQKEKVQEVQEVKMSNAELEALRLEVKQLKDENKALTLYASKIINRIISQEGFEHVLSADYENEGKPKPKPSPAVAKIQTKPRSQSLLARAASLSSSITLSSTTPAPSSAAVARPPLRITTAATEPAPPAGAGLESPATPMGKRERRGLSMDWSKLNPFARGTAPAEQQPPVDPRIAGLKPLTLRADAPRAVPSSPIIVGGRKLDNEEDEYDRIERERLNAEMKLMGIEREPSVHTPGVGVTTFAAAGTGAGAGDAGDRSSVGWGRRPGSVRNDSSPGPGTRIPTEELRAEHLELEDEGQVLAAAAENKFAALDREEKALSAEIAKGKGGGFTEPPARGTRVRRRGSSDSRSQGSGASTLFSAGRLSRGGSELGIGEEVEE